MANDEYYKELGPRLSQGDIIRELPWGMLVDPVTVCRPNDPAKPEGKSRYGEPGYFSNPPGFDNSRKELIHLHALRGPALVMWHDCQVDKFGKQGKPEQEWFVAMCPIVDLRRMGGDEGAQAAVREGKRRAFFFLPADPERGIVVDSYADLRFTLPVKQSAVRDQRVATLTERAREALYGHFFTFLTQRRVVEEVICPGCNAPVNRDLFLENLGEQEDEEVA